MLMLVNMLKQVHRSKKHFFSNYKYDFVFLLHPRGISDLHKKFPITKFVPSSFLIKVFNLLPPLQVATITGLRDENGVSKRGLVLSIPMTAEQMLENNELAKKQVIRAIKKAKKLGISHVGLGAFTSVVTSGGLDIKGVVPGVYVTNGNALTACMSYRGLTDLISEYGITNANISVIGATGSIGHVVTELLTEEGNFENLFVVGRTPSRIEALMQKISNYFHSPKVFAVTIGEALPKSNVIFSATSAKGAVIKSDLVEENTLIYDITQPKNISPDLLQRNNVHIYEGGIVLLPKGVVVNGYIGLSKGTVFACMAETMLLSLANYPDDFCLGHVTKAQVTYIESLAEKYGYRSAKTNKLNNIM